MKIGNGEVSVWDFGGQLEYSVTHQFLLSVEVSSHLINCKEVGRSCFFNKVVLDGCVHCLL
jgi:hypothetical protein